MTQSPSHYAVEVAKLSSSEAHIVDTVSFAFSSVGLGGLTVGERPVFERSELELGARVSLITIDGEFPGTTLQEWTGDGGVIVWMDYGSVLHLHRSMFRAWTALDHLAYT